MRKFFIITAALMLVLTSFGFAQIHIGGNISGVLTDTTYIADDYLRVQSGDTLTIEPGATILFSGYYQLQIYGLLISAGTEEDTIYFQPQDSTAAWGCICFDENSDDNSLLSYCYVTGCALGGVNSVGADVTISHCLITGNTGSWGGGIYLNAADVTVSDCVITGNSVVSCGGGIYATGSAPVITDCLVSYNYCEGQGSGMGGGGICFNHSSIGILANSQVTNNSSGHYGGGIVCADFSDAEIRNCTVSDNSADLGGGGIEVYYAAPVMFNNIVSNNLSGGVNFSNPGHLSLTFSDFSGNETGDFTGNVPPGLGGLAMTNFNGDSCDIFSNIFLDPLFEDPFNGNFNLTEASPCIDAGNPLSPLDPDGTIADIGAFYFHQMPPPPIVDDLAVIIIDNSNVILHWSPFTAVTAYNIYRSTEPYFDISGMIPLASVSEAEYIDGGAVENGPFFYVVTTEIE